MYKNQLLSLILVAFAVALVSSIKVFKLKKLNCIPYEPYTNVTICKLKPISRHISKAYIEGYLKKDYNNGLFHGQIFKLDTVDYKPFLVNFTFNSCDILKRSVTSFYTSYALREMKRVTNIDISRGCPIKAGKYHVMNYTLDDTLIRNLPLPMDTYKAVINVYIEDKGIMQKFVDFSLFVELYEQIK